MKSSSQVVFIDSRAITDPISCQKIPQDSDIVWISPDTDALRTIADYMAAYDTVSLLGWADASGAYVLGANSFDSQSLEEHSSEISQWNTGSENATPLHIQLVQSGQADVSSAVQTLKALVSGSVTIDGVSSDQSPVASLADNTNLDSAVPISELTFLLSSSVTSAQIASLSRPGQALYILSPSESTLTQIASISGRIQN